MLQFDSRTVHLTGLLNLKNDIFIVETSDPRIRREQFCSSAFTDTAMAVENVWGLVAVLGFYVVILVIGIVAGRKQLRRNAESSTTETMLAGRDIGMVRHNLY